MEEYLKTSPPNERHKVKDFERVRNPASGQGPNEGMGEISMVKKNLKKTKGKMKTNLNPKIFKK